MKKILIPIFIAAAFISSCKSDKKNDEAVVETTVQEAPASSSSIVLEGATHMADVTSSEILWKGFKPTGSHDGVLNLKEGAVVYDNSGLQKGVFVIDMSSLKVLDIPADSEDNGKLVGHLSTADFFDTANFPAATYEFDKVENGKMTGNLTIKGITKPLAVPFTLSDENGVITLKAEPVKVDRTAYDIKYKSKKFFDNLKDQFINDEFEVSFKVTLNQK